MQALSRVSLRGAQRRGNLGQELQMRTNLQPEIATTSVRTGLAMTNQGRLSVSLRGAQRRGNLGQEPPAAYNPTAGDCHSQCAHWLRNDNYSAI